MEKMEKELAKILRQVRKYGDHGRVEELTYLAGAALMQIEIMGCPISALRLSLEAVVDKWANSGAAPARDDKT